MVYARQISGSFMIFVVQEWNANEHVGLLDSMYRLRARVFRDKLGWDVQVRSGLERDRFDDESPVYVIHTDELGVVDGSCRLLPTTGPTLLSETFADTLPDAAFLSAPSIWECTRFCVDYTANNRDEIRSTIIASGAVIAGVGELSLRAGIETILGNFDSTMLRIYNRIGCEVEVLGCTHRFGRPVYLGSFPVSQAILSKVNRRVSEVGKFGSSSIAA